MKLLKILFAAILLSTLIAACNNGDTPDDPQVKNPLDTTKVDTAAVGLIDNHQIK